MSLSLIFAVLAGLVLPIGYGCLCGVMRERQVPRPPVMPFFLLFGTTGGWMLAALLAPSALSAGCMALLLTAAPLALLFCSINLAFQRERTPFHRFAMRGGFAYAGLLGIVGIMAMLAR